MPFIVTTKRPSAVFGNFNVYRLAVATLEEAHETAREACLLALGSVAAISQCVRDVFALSDTGGTVGPLPDGTTITVEPITWRELAKVAGTRWSAVVPGWDAKAVTAYNAKHGRSA